MPRLSTYFSYFSSCILIFLLGSCATYYHRQEEFNRLFAKGELEKASAQLNKKKKAATGKEKLLYHLNQGTIYWMLGKYEESNNYFNQADIIAEDYRKSFADYALSYVSNPMTIPYKGEDFEVVLIHYYKALNYIGLGNYESALVECRRLNIRLSQLNDKYKSKNRYSVDAFAHLLTGIVYDAAGEYNNAFIAYRNAYEAYENSYGKLFGIAVPQQLKKDMIRAAYRTGFADQVEFYERKFGMKSDPKEYTGKGEIVFFWNNGLGPVKDENSINFSIVHGEGSYVTFVNNDYGWSFPFYIPNNDTSKKSALSKLEFIRVAFPEYLERKPYYAVASIAVEGKNYPLEQAEDINQIAFKTLQDRMLREMGEAVGRLALKKAAEYSLRKENQEMGAALGIVNAITEKADTRNWQTLPYSISYARIPLPEGKQLLELKALSADKRSERSHSFTFDVKKGRTYFQAFQNLETLPANRVEEYRSLEHE